MMGSNSMMMPGMNGMDPSASMMMGGNPMMSPMMGGGNPMMAAQMGGVNPYSGSGMSSHRPSMYDPMTAEMDNDRCCTIS